MRQNREVKIKAEAYDNPKQKRPNRILQAAVCRHEEALTSENGCPYMKHNVCRLLL